MRKWCGSGADGAGCSGEDLSSQEAGPSIATDPDHAATLLARMDTMRMQGELCDLVLRAENGRGPPKRVHAVVMAAVLPFVRSKMTRWANDTPSDGISSSSSSSSLHGHTKRSNEENAVVETVGGGLWWATASDCSDHGARDHDAGHGCQDD